MGVLYWLVVVEPERWRRACEVFAEPVRLNTTAALADLCARLQIDPRCSVVEAAQESINAGADATEAHGSELFEAAVGDEEIPLHKSLSRHCLEPLFRGVAALAPLRRLVEFRVDEPVPRPLGVRDGGLLGAFVTASIEKWVSCVSLFRSRADIDRYPVPAGALDRLLGRERRTRAALDLLREEYNWYYWQELRRAVDAAISRNCYLAIGLSA